MTAHSLTKCGNVVLEAMASAVPPVVAAAGGPKFLVQHGKTGYIAHNVGEFVGRLLDLHRQAPVRFEMGAEARTSVQRRSWDSVFEQMYRRYESHFADGTEKENARGPEGIALLSRAR